jgi:hypothetical protein
VSGLIGRAINSIICRTFNVILSLIEEVVDSPPHLGGIGDTINEDRRRFRKFWICGSCICDLVPSVR